MITLTFEPTNPEQAALLGQFLPQYMRAGELVVSGAAEQVKAVVEAAAQVEDKPAKKPRATKAAAAEAAPVSEATDEGNAVAAGQDPATADAPAASSAGSSPSTEVTLEQVRAKLAALSQAGKAAEVKDLIGSFGVAKLTDVPTEKYGDLLAKAEEI